MKKTTLLAAALVSMALAGCADDDTTSSTPAPSSASTPERMLYICYSHATCDGATVDQAHRLCADASDQDYVIAGDAAARDWVTLWTGACRADEGIVVPTAELEPGQTCPGTWGCRADCVPQFEECD
jgi:hypothetical protein